MGRIVDRQVDVGLVRWVGRKVAYVHPLDESAIAAARKFWRLLEEAAQQLAHVEEVARISWRGMIYCLRLGG